MSRLAITLIVAATLAVVTVGVATAKGTLEITSGAPVTLGAAFTLHGCGYPVPSSISFEVSGPRKSDIHYFTAGEPVDSDGCFTDEWLAWWDVGGEYQITSWYRNSHGSTSKAAVLKFTVVP